MLVLANEMFDSPPVFAWVLPVFVRLKPGKEETFFSVCVCVECLIGKQNKPTLFKVTEPSSVPSRSRIFSTWSTSKRRQTMKGPGGSTYANPGRPKSFQPTPHDRQRTGNIARIRIAGERSPVFVSAQMRGGLEASRPRASPRPDLVDPDPGYPSDSDEEEGKRRRRSSSSSSLPSMTRHGKNPGDRR
jgi:hypothetical protein